MLKRLNKQSARDSGPNFSTQRLPFHRISAAPFHRRRRAHRVSEGDCYLRPSMTIADDHDICVRAHLFSLAACQRRWSAMKVEMK
jgi:hypothetical protein